MDLKVKPNNSGTSDVTELGATARSDWLKMIQRPDQTHQHTVRSGHLHSGFLAIVCLKQFMELIQR